MTRIETNVYAITNLNELNCKYRIYQVRGLSPDEDEYYKNTQLLNKQLTYKTRSPCHFFETREGNFIAQPDGYQVLPKIFGLVRANVKIELQQGLRELRFDSKDTLHLELIRRFLQFSLQNPLYNNPKLWQPRAGYPYYHKNPDQKFRSLSETVDLYKGFTFRIIFCQGAVGICVDTASKYAARYPLPTKIMRNNLEHYKGLNCLYEYGQDWYEIKIDGLSDMSANELPMPNGTTLYDDLTLKHKSVSSPNFLSMPKDCSVLIYRNNSGQTRHAPSGLCRPTYTTDHPEIKALHSKTIKAPDKRREEIQFVVNQYLRNLNFANRQIKLSNKPISSSPERVPVPRLKFGNNQVLSIGQQSKACIAVSITEHARKKKELFFANGPYKKKQLDAQYIVLPRSVHKTYGHSFLHDLRNAVDRLLSYPDQQYSPIVIPYDNSIQTGVYDIARAITASVDKSGARPGYAVVMVPLKRSTIIKEDELANIIMQKLRKRDFRASVIHTTVPQESYDCIKLKDGSEQWRMTQNNKMRSRIKGYLQGVAINKILLLNSMWPFVLDTELNSDLTIGIDVKNRVAGFTFVYKTGEDIRFFDSESHDREQLSHDHIRTRISQYLQDEKEMLRKYGVKNIVIHRQGRLFPGEMQGITDALKDVARNGLLPRDYSCTFTEVKKTSSVPFRLFHIKSISESQRETAQNPMIGSFFPVGISDNEAFLCNTGYPYRHRGTAKPIHVAKIKGSMPMKDILRDIFFLANLTWTKIDDCSRDPLTIKMADIRLREVAGHFDADAYKFAEDDSGGVQDE